jgi:hypothetical protein
MKIFNLKLMVKGWFIGNFEPNAYKTAECEIGVKKYVKGDYEYKHFHKKAVEVTLIISGKVKMGNKIFKSNDIILIEKDEAVDFEVLEDTITVVYKSRSVSNDKFFKKNKSIKNVK